MPEFYPSIGDAVAATMQSNIRLAYGDPASDINPPQQDRHRARTSAAPGFVPGRRAQDAETAAEPMREPPDHVDSEVSIGVHPRFGIVAMTTDTTAPLAVRLLGIAGFDALGDGTHVLDDTDDDRLHAHNVVTVLRAAGVSVRSDLPPVAINSTARAARTTVAAKQGPAPATAHVVGRPARHR